MLVLTRRIGETIIINDNIEITLLEMKGNQAKIAIKAPKEIAVHRSEVYDRIKAENADPES